MVTQPRFLERHAPAAMSGGLLGAATAPIALLAWAQGEALDGLEAWRLTSSVSASVILAVAGGILVAAPRTGAVLGALGLLAGALPVGEALVDSPAATLAVLVVVILTARALLHVAAVGAVRRESRRSLVEGRGRGAAWAALGLWLADSFAGGVEAAAWLGSAAVLISEAITLVFVVSWVLDDRRRSARRLVPAATVLALIAAAMLAAWGDWRTCVTAGAALPAFAALAMPRRSRWGAEGSAWWQPVLDHPERLLTATFLVLSVVGTFVLALPVCSSSGERLDLVDALFTAVSAVCVTGLIVRDTGSDFSATGQVVLLVLIQLGGLGIMTFSTAALRLLGRRLSLRHESAVARLLSPEDRGQLFRATRRLITFTLACEAIGAVLLGLLFVGAGDTPGQAAWRGTFTAVSAFCNAGFALQGDSLMPYADRPLILHAVAVLIILGGLSPAVVIAWTRWLAGGGERLGAQARVAIWTTAVLLLLGFGFTLIVEWSGSLALLDPVDRVHNAWFHSVTLRTAGFNAIDLEQLRPASITLSLVLMFIGGSPGGTAGGVKTTTFTVLVLAVVAAVRGRWFVEAYGRRVTHRTVYRATAITTLGGASLLAGLLAVLLTQDMSTSRAFFEVTSALGTVGLSLGGTAELDGVGKAIIVACMFAGRVGPLTLFMFLSQRAEHTPWARPEEDFQVG